MRVTCLVVLACAACEFPKPADVSGDAGSDADPASLVHQVGGQVRGLWDGTDGVALRLESDAVNTLLTVAHDGSFSFAKPLAKGASYTVTVATNPASHSCVVAVGGNGTVADADITNSSVLCTGPAKDIALTGQWGWRFDPTSETQQFSGSILAQDVALTIAGDDLTGATISGAAATIGAKTAPIALALGTTTMPVALTAKGGLSKTYQLGFARAASLLDQAAYGKASNTGAFDHMGTAVAISGDTMVVGAPDENSAATGINGDQTDNTGRHAGAVYVFVRSGTTWTQQAYLKASNTILDIAAFFGKSVALSGDTLAVGADLECNSAPGINVNQNTGSFVVNSGAVYVFVRTGTTWSQQAYVKATNPGTNDNFGLAVALSGNTLAVSAPNEASAATGIGGNQADDTADGAGAVYVFARSGATWHQQAYIKPSNTEKSDEFGMALALDGDTLAVGAIGEDSAATTIDGDQTDNNASFAGAVYVFSRIGASWSQQAYLKASNANAGDAFGGALALSGDTLVVGANEDSAATGSNGDPTNNTADAAGAAYVFVRSGTTWTQQAYLKASNTHAGDGFGFSPGGSGAGETTLGTAVALSGDLLAVGAHAERSASTGVGGDQSDTTKSGAGAVYLFSRTGSTWTQQAYIKASNTGQGDEFGFALALSGDTLVVGSPFEASAATGINGRQADETASGAGAVYLFR